MAQHSRPLPSPATAGLVPPFSDAPAPQAHHVRDEPEVVGPSPETSAGVPRDAGRLDATRGSPEGPWYRREAWLAFCLAAFVPIGVAFAVPHTVKVPLLGAGVALAVVGLALLLWKEIVRPRRAHVATRDAAVGHENRARASEP